MIAPRSGNRVPIPNDPNDLTATAPLDGLLTRAGCKPLQPITVIAKL